MRNALRKRPPVGSHQWINLVDLAVHRAIARKIRREPRLFARASRTLERWVRVKRACPPSVREWKQILSDNDMLKVLRILTRPGEEGNRLRSISPFCGVLDESEVKAIWARYDEDRI